MSKYKPEIKPEKKQLPKTPKLLLVIMWALFVSVFLLDTYRFVFSSGGVSLYDVFFDVGIFVVAVYLTARNRGNKNK